MVVRSESLAIGDDQQAGLTGGSGRLARWWRTELVAMVKGKQSDVCIQAGKIVVVLSL